MWIGLGIGAAVLCTAIVVVGVVVIKKRNAASEANSDEPETGNELGEYTELSAPKPSNYTELSIDQPIRSSTADSNVYDSVDSGPDKSPYETVSADGLTEPEHTYKTIDDMKE